MSSRMKRRSQQQKNLTNDASALKKLKHYFIKGSKVQKEETSLLRPKEDSQRQIYPDQFVPSRDPYDSQGQDLFPPREPRQLPRAVHVEARKDQDEVENESIFSSSSTAQSSSLTSTQSSRPSERSRPKPSKKRTSDGLPISAPRPTDSLLHLASQYADVQNPKKAYDSTRRPALPANVKPPLYTEANRKTPERKISQPVKEVAKGRAQVIQGPAHQRSQKTVVRKAEPQPAKRADDRRHMSHVTVFEDFMGNSSPPMPPLPPVPKLFPAPSQAHRLSRPFREEAPEYEKPNNDAASEDISPTSMAISPTESHAQTWLKYDRNVSLSTKRQSTNAPLFPRRNMTRPDSNQQYKWTPCQSCRKQIHPSTAVSNNGTYFCQDCAASALSARFNASHVGEAELVEEGKKKKSAQKILYPYAASAYPAKTDKITRKPLPSPSSSSTSSITNPQTQSPRTRRKDIPPEYLHIYSPPFNPLSPPSSTPPSPSLTQPLRPHQTTSSYYSTPLPDGTYPRYRTPPPPPPPHRKPPKIPSPLTIPPLTSNPTEDLHPRLPASSIYPSTSRLSRPPSLPSTPPLPSAPIPPLPSTFTPLPTQGGKAEEGRDTRARTKKRSDTLDTKASDRSYRAAMEEEVIDAYADLYTPDRERGGEGGNRGWSPVSPLSPLSNGKGREMDRDSVVSECGEYEGVGWRMKAPRGF
ncbi:MAG: hypothetical protein LQ343_001292 [Gyalolechia ehrenbergii]|nr:MAG: hypothetical protein LQ343_001292 [Gyalolechia ehrenbergii]